MILKICAIQTKEGKKITWLIMWLKLILLFSGIF